MNEIVLKLMTEKFPLKSEAIYAELQKDFAAGGQDAIKNAIQGALIAGAMMYVQEMAEAEAKFQVQGNA